jgi:hypothetical protein
LGLKDAGTPAVFGVDFLYIYTMGKIPTIDGRVKIRSGVAMAGIFGRTLHLGK